ncbi:MAG: hypothetical protein KBB54_01300 [Candidatus Pacebacteria bacterium]|nr:hypothetical protein [Candidatus Paceibacterota bacterium]
MTKQELIKEIDGKIDIAHSCIEAGYIFGSKMWVEGAKNYVTPGLMYNDDGKVVFMTKSPQELVLKYYDPVNAEEMGHNLTKLGISDMITQTFELISKYCKESKQEAILESFPWFHFARIIRNSISHLYNVEIGHYNGKVVPNQKLQFSDREIEITKLMHGNEFDYKIFPIEYSFELVDMMKASLVDLN